MAACFDLRFGAVFPADTNRDKKLFNLLRRAYVDARYSKRDAVTGDELQAVAGRVEVIQELTAQVCEARIAAVGRRWGAMIDAEAGVSTAGTEPAQFQLSRNQRNMGIVLIIIGVVSAA